MGHQLYCVVYKAGANQRIHEDGKAENGKSPRLPRATPRGRRRAALVQRKLDAKMPHWQASNIIPDEEIDTRWKLRPRPSSYTGIVHWSDLLQSAATLRSLHQCRSVSTRCSGKAGDDRLDRAAMTYLALALDKMLNYNAIAGRVARQPRSRGGHFRPAQFRFQVELRRDGPHHRRASATTGPSSRPVKPLGELIELLGRSADEKLQFQAPRPKPTVRITCGSADALSSPMPPSTASSWTLPTTTTSCMPSCPTSSTSGSSARPGCSIPSFLGPPDRQGPRSRRQPGKFRRPKQAPRTSRAATTRTAWPPSSPSSAGC